MNVNESLWFHLDGCKTPYESLWFHISSMQLYAKLIALSPNDFPTLIDYLTKFKELLTQLKGSGKKKEDKECVYLILSKLRGPF